jgi:hypothetical protein
MVSRRHPLYPPFRRLGCAAASMSGVKAPGEAAPGRQRKRFTQDDLRRKNTWPNL